MPGTSAGNRAVRIDFRNPLDQTPLMIAAKMGLVDLVAAFSRGCRPEPARQLGRAPFQLALRPRMRTRVCDWKIGPLYEISRLRASR